MIEAGVSLVLVSGCLLFFVRIKIQLVSGASMDPTLVASEHLFIEKDNTPQRYDIITFIPKEEPKKSYVKRAIGMLGNIT